MIGLPSAKGILRIEASGVKWGLMPADFTPDSRKLVTPAADGSLLLWDVPPRKPLGVLITRWMALAMVATVLYACRAMARQFDRHPSSGA